MVFAQQVRKMHRRRTDKLAETRLRDIDAAFDRLRTAMRPLRSASGKFVYGPQTDVAEENREIIRRASAAIQRERRKLWKMRKPPKRLLGV